MILQISKIYLYKQTLLPESKHFIILLNLLLYRYTQKQKMQHNGLNAEYQSFELQQGDNRERT